MAERTALYVVSVLARDHVGIIADVTEALYELGGNLEALSQTVVGEWFTMIVRGDFPESVTREAIKDAIEVTDDVQAIVAPYGRDGGRAQVEGAPFVVTAIGEDIPGIVCRLARCLADLGVNIEDVWNEVHGAQFIEIFYVTVPLSVDPKELRYALETAAAQLPVKVRLQHLDIFTATNSLSVHTGR